MRTSIFFIVLLLVLCSLPGCTPKVAESTVESSPTNVNPENSFQKQANMLAQKYIITDGHVDLPYRLKVSNFRLTKEFLEIPIESEKGDFDYVRSKAGGLDAPFMSIYLPANLQSDPGASKSLADSLINMINGICEKHPDKFQVAHWAQDVRTIAKTNKIALPMGMENGSGIEDDLANIKYFKERGISYITLTHSKDNQICDSSYDTTGTWGGLSPFGRKVVLEMNKQGVMVDISHVSDKTFYEVMEITNVPVIASHSSCRKFTPGFQRNMNDEMIKMLESNGGVIMINFGSTFIDQKVKEQRWQLGLDMNKFLEEKGLTRQDEQAKPLMEQYLKDHPGSFSDVQMVANHIDHVVSLVGVDHVGFGSDFDGVGDSLPTGLKDVGEYPNLIAELLKRGYSEKDIQKICSGNLFRVWEAVQHYAEK